MRQMCEVHPDVPYIVRESTSVNGGHIGWGCAVCNMLKLEEARRRIERLEAALRLLMTHAQPAPDKAQFVIINRQFMGEARAALAPKEPTI